MTKQQIYKIAATAVTALLTCLAIALGLTSCNVTRTITTQSQYMQRGDTSVVIQTKTIETYDASTLPTTSKPCRGPRGYLRGK